MTTNSSNKYNNNTNYSNSSFISPGLSLQNTKYFLETYKTSRNNSLFSEKFINECPLYTKDSQIPDSFYKLHRPFDRNLVFYISHGPYGTSRRNNNHFYKFNQNFYPKYPLILSSSCDLISKVNKKNKNKNNVEEGHKTNENVEESEKDFMMNDFVNKVWSMKLYHENSNCEYGPYTSKVIFQFLKNYYIPLNPQEQKKMNLLISDLMYDVYYQPDSLYQMLQEELNKN